MTAHVIAVTGGKGGVGKSTTTINLGVSLRMDGHSVALIDADVEMPNLVELLGIEPRKTIHDVLAGQVDPEQALLEIGEGFAAIPGDPSISGYAGVDSERLEKVVETFATAYDYIILDTGAGLSYDDLMPLGLADEIVLVSSPDPAAVKNAKRTQAFIRQLNRPVRGVVITKADASVDGSIADEFDTTLLAVIPDDQAVRLSTAAGKPLEIYAPNCPAAQAYRQLEANLTDGVLPPPRSDQSTRPTANTVVETAGHGQSTSTSSNLNEEAQDPDEDAPTDPPETGYLSRILRHLSP